MAEIVSLKNKNFLILTIIFIFLEILIINSRGVWAPDEARYARVAYEMKERQSYLIPFLNGELYREKPPLFFDFAILFSIFKEGLPHYSVKLVSLFGAITVLILSTFLAVKLGLKNCYLVALILIGMPKFLWQSQFGQIDMLLCSFVLSQILVGIYVIESAKKISFWYLLLLAFFSFLAILSKGPAGVLPVYISLILITIFVKKQKKILNLIISILMTLIFTTFWLYLAGIYVGFDYSKSLVLKQTVTRYLDPWHHYAPFYYYFLVIFADGFPFIFMFIPALIESYKRKLLKEKQFLYPLTILFVYIIFFSISSGKRSVYILPVYPMVAIFLSFAIEKWLTLDFPKKRLTIFTSVTFVFPFFAIIYLYKRVTPFYSFDILVLVFGFLFYLLGIFLFLYYLLKKKEFYPQLFTICTIILVLTSLPALHTLDEIKTPYDFVSSIKPFTKCGIELGVYPDLVPSVNYYLEKNTKVFKEKEEEKAYSFLSDGNLLLIKEKTIPKILQENSFVISKGQIGNEKFLLLVSRKD